MNASAETFVGEQPLVSSPPPPPRQVTFEGCIGWLHLPAAGQAGHGVILCSPLAHEELATHAGWRVLGRMLAEAGLAALRFGYPGTGDSAGDEDEPDRLERWIESIVAAAAWMRRCCGVSGISLVGLRLGAPLAALAAARIEGVHTLALLSPVVSGRHFVREMRLLASAWWAESSPNQRPLDTPPGCLDVVGYRWDAASLRALAAIDLHHLARWPQRVLVMDEQARPDLAAAVRARAGQVSVLGFPGALDFLVDPLRSVVPQAAFETLCALLATEADQPPHAAMTLDPPRIELAHAVEEPLAFGPDQRMNALLCRPAREAPGRPAMLILNTGLTHRIGHSRMSVLLARALARAGVASLRIDGTGIGDTPLPPGGQPTKLFDLRSVADVMAAVDALQALDFGPVTVFGMCAGGYQAFHAALADPRIAGIIVLNMPKFIWLGGPVSDVRHESHRRATGIYLQALLRRDSWARVLRGEINMPRLAFDLAWRMVRTLRRRAMRWLEGETGWETEAGRVERWLRSLAARGVRVQMFYSEADPGLADLHMEVSMRRIGRDARGFSLDILPDADHNMLGRIEVRDQFVARAVSRFTQTHEHDR